MVRKVSRGYAPSSAVNAGGGGGGTASGSLEHHGTEFKGEAGRLMLGAGVISMQSLIGCLGDIKEGGSA